MLACVLIFSNCVIGLILVMERDTNIFYFSGRMILYFAFKKVLSKNHAEELCSNELIKDRFKLGSNLKLK